MSTKKKPARRRAKPLRPTPKPRSHRSDPKAPRVDAGAVALVHMKGTPGRGGGTGGEAWRIEVGGHRVGVTFVNLIDEPPIGRHASIQIYLNQRSQGRGIGRVAYRMACEASRYDIIYAHMRKSNIASRRAAEAAGFHDATPAGQGQLIMVRKREAV